MLTLRIAVRQVQEACGDIVFGLFASCLVWVGIGRLFQIKGDDWQTTTSSPVLSVVTYLVTIAAPAIEVIGWLGVTVFVLLVILECKKSATTTTSS